MLVCSTHFLIDDYVLTYYSIGMLPFPVSRISLSIVTVGITVLAMTVTFTIVVNCCPLFIKLPSFITKNPKSLKCPGPSHHLVSDHRQSNQTFSSALCALALYLLKSYEIAGNQQKRYQSFSLG